MNWNSALAAAIFFFGTPLAIQAYNYSIKDKEETSKGRAIGAKAMVATTAVLTVTAATISSFLLPH